MSEGTVAADQLRLFVERIERLEEEKKGISDDVRDVYAEAKANGYDPKIMRMIVRLRKMETHTRQEQDAVLETYRAALGMGSEYVHVTIAQSEEKTPLEAAIDGDAPPDEVLYAKAVEVVRDSGKASVSYLQRQLRIGYNSAAGLMERMEREGLVSRPDNVGRRELRTAIADWQSHLAKMDAEGIGVSIGVGGGPMIPLNETAKAAGEQVH
jgi:uncharacterized protein (UPF0335 family)